MSNGPNYTKTILCLANSRKMVGRCIAGKEWNDDGSIGSWVRPVSERPTEEISEEERRYDNGADPKVLQIVRVPMRQPNPKHYQTENHLIDSDFYWAKIQDADWAMALNAVDQIEGDLWVNGFTDFNDRVPETIARDLNRSLYLIGPLTLRIHVAPEGINQRRKVRGSFTFNDSVYRLAVTDPIIERQYLNGPDRHFDIQNVLLCISLGELFKGYAYKLIAAVIQQ